MDIARLTGLSYPSVRRAIDLHARGGAAALKPARRGRAAGQGRSLSAEQDRVRRTICDKRPEQLKMGFALWTRAAVMQLIERQCGVSLSLRAVGQYLRRWGFTPQKPIKRAYEPRPEAVKQWLEHEYPAIEQRAKAECGELHRGDETALVNTDVRGRGHAPRGKTPVAMAVGGTREKLFLILDNLGVHHCKPVKARLAEHTKHIEVFVLPSYSPELNPDERLNADLNHAIGAKVPQRTKAKLHAAATEHMQFIKANPQRVRSYFQDPIVRHAA